MKNILLFYFGLLLLLSCNIKNDLKIEVNKETVLPGELFVARIYVNHNDSIAPEYFIIRETDTIQFEPDPSDNYCGIYRASFNKIGKKSINGIVKFLDKQDKWQILEYKIKFEVIPNLDRLTLPQ